MPRRICRNLPGCLRRFLLNQFPTAEFWQRLFASAPSTLRFALKIPEEVTLRVFPGHPRYGQRLSTVNPNFLDMVLLKSEFLDLLTPYRDRIAVLIFEFGTFSKASFADVNEFLNMLAPLWLNCRAASIMLLKFQRRVPKRRLFAFLHDANIAHVFNSWTRMPPLEGQLLMEGAFTAGLEGGAGSTAASVIRRCGEPIFALS